MSDEVWIDIYKCVEKVITDYCLTHCGVDTRYSVLNVILRDNPKLSRYTNIINEVLSDGYVFKDKRLGVINGFIVMDINPNDAEQTQLAFRNMGLYDN